MKTANVPKRMCTGCREMKDKKELLRILRSETGEILLDETGKRNGRGAYLCRNPECLRKARKSHGLERSLKLSVPEEIYDRLEKELEELHG